MGGARICRRQRKGYTAPTFRTGGDER
jgi:hypothetical protein